MNNKIDLFLDFDDTICLTSKQFVKLANKKYKKEEDWNNINRWDFKDLYPEITNNDIIDTENGKNITQYTFDVLVEGVQVMPETV